MKFNIVSKEVEDTVLLQMENMQTEYGTEKHQKALLQLLNEIYDKSLNLPRTQFPIYYSKTQQLHRLFVVPPYAKANSEGDLPTSSVGVEREIAKYISECLPSSHERNSNIDQILTLIEDYKVVQPLGQKNQSVSLERVHSILEDNFQDSSLCKLFDILLKGNEKTATKVITFF